MRVRNRFERGSGCYTCRSCGRKTRSTGRGDNELIQLCEECYELAGIENMISDQGIEVVDDALSHEIVGYINLITSKGGKPSFEYMDLLK